MVVRNYFAIAPMIEEIYQKYGVYTMEYVITPPLHLWQSIYSGDIYGVYTMVVHSYFPIAPTLLEKPAYNQQYLLHAPSHEDPL